LAASGWPGLPGRPTGRPAVPFATQFAIVSFNTASQYTAEAEYAQSTPGPYVRRDPNKPAEYCQLWCILKALINFFPALVCVNIHRSLNNE
jgi:hypothetical protein